MNTKKPLNILISRSVVATSMGYIVKGTLAKFGSNSHITIITRPENEQSMLEIQGVDQVIFNMGNTFDVKNETRDSMNILRNLDFDIIVIPINGQIGSYDNLTNYMTSFWKEAKVCFFQFPNTFIKYKKNNARKYMKKLLTVITWPISIAFMLAYFLLALPFFIYRGSYLPKR